MGTPTRSLSPKQYVLDRTHPAPAHQHAPFPGAERRACASMR
ncbi:MAG: hypothetical protein AB7G48_02085 [Nitrospiraceae bacterium]